MGWGWSSGKMRLGADRREGKELCVQTCFLIRVSGELLVRWVTRGISFRFSGDFSLVIKCCFFTSISSTHFVNGTYLVMSRRRDR